MTDFDVAHAILNRVRLADREDEDLCGEVTVDHCHWWGDFYGPATSEFLARVLAHRYLDRQGGDGKHLRDALERFGTKKQP